MPHSIELIDGSILTSFGIRDLLEAVRDYAGDELAQEIESYVSENVEDINSDEQEDILKYLIAGGDLSMYGLSNAVTRVSQDVESYDRATTLEGIGWQVATMEPAQWKQINQ